MSKSNSKGRFARTILGAVLGFAVVIGSSGISARAADEEEDNAPDIQAIRGLLKALGLRRGDEAEIDYRERSPLVLPPGRALPPPESANAAAKAAGWPDDPDLKRERKARAERRKPPPSAEEQERVLRPNELNIPGAVARRGTGSTKGISAEDADNPSTNSELGAKSIFTKSAFGFGLGDQKERATFTREPQRSSLTEPPPGYRTPSPNQPYGIGQEKWKKSDVPDPHEDTK